MSVNNNNNKKHIVVSEYLHKRLKIRAAQDDKDLGELAEELILQALKE